MTESSRIKARAFSVCLSLAVLMAAGGFLAHAALAKAKVLTQDAVKQFIASYPDVKTIVAAEAAEKSAGVSSPKDGIAVVVAAVSDKAVKTKIDSAVKAHGFSGSQEWVQVAQSVGQAYAHIKTGGADEKTQRKLQKAIEKIRKNDFLSEKQKEKLIEAIKGGADTVLEPPPAENVAAVKPMVAQIEAVVK
jgi:heterodisulfide reductase subunit A-like polyferredoxin